MTRNTRNTRFFWFMLVLLGVSIYVGLMYATTIDSCGRNAKHYWQYVPPRWVCTPP